MAALFLIFRACCLVHQVCGRDGKQLDLFNGFLKQAFLTADCRICGS